ncbi:MAG: phytoene/squalene synthase family protein [Thermoanaerobaculales bacterium]|jgi:phytoene synthase|nr:phytoene/squalene synthase family protein [Thermoanaerobaculales bacterium]
MDHVVNHGQAVIEKGSKSFAAAAKLFDPATRGRAYMLYAWCRHCDDETDDQELGFDGSQLPQAEGRARVDRLRTQTLGALSGAPTDDPIFAGLQRVVSDCEIPHRYPMDHLDGFVMDVEGREYRTLTDTVEYCYHVAGVVGVMMAYIMGVRDEPTLDRATDLGLAFQLTNICRDVVEDAEVGRVYLPRDLLAAAGVPTAGLAAPEHRDRLFEVVGRVLAEADRYYESAWLGISQLPPRSAWAVAAANAVYGDIGRQILARGARAWDTRTSTSKARKIALVLGAGPRSWKARRWGKGPHDEPRDRLWTRPQTPGSPG